MVIPNSKAHLAIGLVAWFIVEEYLHIPLWAVLLGSLLPDCDTRFSPMGKILPMWIFFRHRGMVHSLWASAVGAVLFGFFLSWGSSLGLLFGYIVHLVADSFTPMGINWTGKKKARR